VLRFSLLVDNLSDWTGKVLSFCTVALMVILVYEVVMRYVFDAPTVWAHGLSGLIYVTCFMLGGSYALRHKAHVSVDILYNRFTLRGRAILDIATSLFMGLICSALLWYGWKWAWKSIQSQETSAQLWSPPLYPVKILIFVAVVLLVLQAFAKFIRDVNTAIHRNEIT